MNKILVLLCWLVILGGCGGAPGQIDVVIENPSEEQRSDDVVFTGEVTTLGSRVSSLSIENVRIVFEVESGEVMDTASVGTINDTDFRHNISVTLNEPPDRILIETGDVDSDGTVVLQGLRRNETGGYEYFEQEKIE